MNLVSLGKAVRPVMNGLTTGKGSTEQTTVTNKTVQASRTFGKGRWSFIVRAKARGAYGRSKGNFLNIGVYHQAGVRYILTLFEDDADKLDGNVSTAGIDGIGATTVEAIVYKINNTALNEWIEAETYPGADKAFSNYDFTGAGGITAADATPLYGGRG